MSPDDFRIYESFKAICPADLVLRERRHNPRVHILLTEWNETLCHLEGTWETDLDPDLPFCLRCAVSARKRLREAGP